jgi:hypothetical protein
LRAPSDPARTLDVALLERTPPSNVLSTEPWDTRNIKILTKGTINNQGGAIEVTSGRVRWQEFARLPLGQLKKGEAVRLRFRIVNGMVRFSLHGDQQMLFFENVGKWPTADKQEIVLTAPLDVPDAILGLESLYPNGSLSHLLIYQIEKMTPSF